MNVGLLIAALEARIAALEEKVLQADDEQEYTLFKPDFPASIPPPPPSEIENHSWLVSVNYNTDDPEDPKWQWLCCSNGTDQTVAGRIKRRDGGYQDVPSSGWQDFDEKNPPVIYLKLTINKGGVTVELIAYPSDDGSGPDPAPDEQLNPTSSSDIVLVYELATITDEAGVLQWISSDIDLTGKLFPSLLDGWGTDKQRPVYVDTDGTLKLGDTTTCT